MEGYFTNPVVIWITKILAVSLYYWVPAALAVATVKAGLALVFSPPGSKRSTERSAS